MAAGVAGKQGPVAARQAGSAYLVGGGIAALAAAVYLISEGDMPGEHIHIFELGDKAGGALDGAGSPEQGYVIRGGRMHESHFGCTWDLLSRIPTLEDSDTSVTDEIFDFNRRVVTGSNSRLLWAGEKMDVASYGLSKQHSFDMLRLLFHTESTLGNKAIEDWFSKDFFETVFWLLWSTTFAFQRWSSLVEMRRYFVRFIHLLPGFNRLAGIMRTVYNQYDSVVAPIERWLDGHGVNFHYSCTVQDIDFEIDGECKTATALQYRQHDELRRIDLDRSDLLFVTLGSMVENSSLGTMREPAALPAPLQQGAWALWKKIATRDPAFGRPGVFCDQVRDSSWMSFTVTLKEPGFFNYMESFTGNAAGTGGLVTMADSGWFMSVVLAYQPHFRNQPDDVFVFWGDGLSPYNVGDFVSKPMAECNGEEILIELFSHLRILERMRPAIGSMNCIPCMMPYIDSQFMPRSAGDRPEVIPAGASNFAFLGQFVELPGDCVFTVEYSVRGAQTAVFGLLGLDREVTPIYEGHHDIEVLLAAIKAVNR